MSELMNELYYMMEDQVGQELIRDEAVKSLEDQRRAWWDKLIHRFGEDGEEIREVIRDLDLELETIHDQALFRAAVRFGAELRGPAVS